MECDDVLGRMFSMLDIGSSYKTVILVCHRWSAIIARVHPNAHIKFANQLWMLVKMFPRAGWSWKYLSANPCITWKIMRENPSIDGVEIPWVVDLAGGKSDVTWEYVQANPEIQWDPYVVSKNPNITWEHVQANPDYPWSWLGLYENSNIAWEIIRANPTRGWDYSGCRELDLIAELSMRSVNWQMYSLYGLSKKVSWQTVVDNPGIQWDHSGLSANPNITLEIIRANLTRFAWNWGWITAKMPLDVVLTHTRWAGTTEKIPWSHWGLSRNPGITMEMVLGECPLGGPWEMDNISSNLAITLGDIDANPNLAWYWPGVMGRPDLTWEFAARHMDKLGGDLIPLDWNYFGR